MKIKVPQMLGGVSGVLLFLANFLFVINWIDMGYGVPSWNLSFWTWPITFVFEILGILLFVILFKQPVFRYLAFGLFIMARFVYSVYWMNSNNESTFYLLRELISWPYFGSIDFFTVAKFVLFISTVLFVVTFVLSFFFNSEEPEPFASPTGNFTTTQRVVSPSINANIAPSKISDIELLGDLLAKGLLTQEEFDRKKKEILGFN